jgi:hypothetical protein
MGQKTFEGTDFCGAPVWDGVGPDCEPDEVAGIDVLFDDAGSLDTATLVLVLETVLETAPEELGIDDDTWSLDTGALVLVMETAPEELGLAKMPQQGFRCCPWLKLRSRWCWRTLHGGSYYELVY